MPKFKLLFTALFAISAGLLVAAVVIAWTNPTANPPGGSGAGFFPSGTSIVFFQASCPAGWTQNVSNNDRLIRIAGTGGGTGGSWTISGLSNTGVGDHNHSTPAHGHSLATWGTEIGWTTGGAVYKSGKLRIGSSGTQTTMNIAADYTETSGGGTSGNAGSHNHTISADGGWRPAYLDAIICVKN